MSNSFLYKESHPCTGIISPQECSVCILHKKGLRFGTPEVLTWLGSNLQKALVVKGFRKALNYPLYVKKHKGDLALLNKYCSKVFVFSGWYKRLLIKNEFDEKKIVELPPSVTGDIRVKDWRKETLETGSVVRFVYIGRIASIKGLHVALAAFSRLKQKNWLFDIYGHNTDEDYLRLCKSLAAENPRINWLGPFKQADVLAMLPEYHALIFPSLVQETMGLCMLEALASKIPVIGSSIWAIEETIEQQKNGYIFRRGDDKDLQRIIEQILAEPAVLPYLATNIQRIDNMSASADLVGSTYLAIHSSQAPR